VNSLTMMGKNTISEADRGGKISIYTLSKDGIGR
jgi:hypothetical protein